jgi:hypothetical protein
MSTGRLGSNIVCCIAAIYWRYRPTPPFLIITNMPYCPLKKRVHEITENIRDACSAA